MAPFPGSKLSVEAGLAMDPKGFNRADFQEKMKQEMAAFFSTSLFKHPL